VENDLKDVTRFRRPTDATSTAGPAVMPADQDAPAAFGAAVRLGYSNPATLARVTLKVDSLGGGPRGGPTKGPPFHEVPLSVSTTRRSSQARTSPSEYRVHFPTR
jgi:hypothetical protein